MFNIFKKKSELDKLNDTYKKLLEEAYRLSHSNRVAGDAKMAEANEVAQRLEKLRLGDNK
ncbi:MAG: Lacal_2735 family protein [Flavobacteriales bacterium]|nr:Lacal_2735 family protein [Flavobacteriales bacterium]